MNPYRSTSMPASTAAQLLLTGEIEEAPVRTFREEVEAFSKASQEEEGLLNMSQAGVYLDVSKQRVQQLVDCRKLTPFSFMGRVYISFRELKEFSRVNRPPGRPIGERIVKAVKMAGHSMVDPMQLKHDVTRDFKVEKRAKK